MKKLYKKTLSFSYLLFTDDPNNDLEHIDEILEVIRNENIENIDIKEIKDKKDIPIEWQHNYYVYGDNLTDLTGEQALELSQQNEQ